MSWLENTSQIKGLPDVAINTFSFIDCDALTNAITIIFYVCILDIIRNLYNTQKLGAMYPFKVDASKAKGTTSLETVKGEDTTIDQAHVCQKNL